MHGTFTSAILRVLLLCCVFKSFTVNDITKNKGWILCARQSVTEHAQIAFANSEPFKSGMTALSVSYEPKVIN